MKKVTIFSVALVVNGALLTGCMTAAPTTNDVTEKNKLTTGQVQLTLKKNQTTQTEVVEAFGAPNLVTVNSDGEEV